MVNHFRTLLLNLAAGDVSEEFIPAAFKPIVLPTGLSRMYNVLFPPVSSREHKLFLATMYLQLIESTDFREHVLLYDPRITYDLTSNRYFKINRISTPVVSDSNFPIFITGSVLYDKAKSSSQDQIQVMQIGATNAIEVRSLVTGESLYSGTLVFTDGASNVVFLGTHNIQFYITGQNFMSTANKTWLFSLEVPYPFDFPGLFLSLSSDPTTVTGMFAVNKGKCDIMYENLWQQHKNSVYQMAGLLLAYVQRVHSIGVV